MPQCPKCRALYEPQFTACAVCLLPLEPGGTPQAAPTAPADEIRPPSRKRLFIETLLVTCALWGYPMLWALWGRKNELGPLTAASEIYQAVLELGWILVLFTLVWTNREPYSTLGFRRVRWQPELIWAALILGAQWAVAWALVALAASLDWMPGPSDHPRDDGTLLFRLVAPFSLAVGALFEEAFFRGYLWRRIEMLTGRPAAALLITSTLFAAYHPYSWWATAQVFVFGLIMGAFYWKGRSVPRLALAHALFNVLIVYA